MGNGVFRGEALKGRPSRRTASRARAHTHMITCPPPLTEQAGAERDVHAPGHALSGEAAQLAQRLGLWARGGSLLHGPALRAEREGAGPCQVVVVDVQRRMRGGGGGGGGGGVPEVTSEPARSPTLHDPSLVFPITPPPTNAGSWISAGSIVSLRPPWRSRPPRACAARHKWSWCTEVNGTCHRLCPPYRSIPTAAPPPLVHRPRYKFTTGLKRPNGLAFSPDFKTLYVANSDADDPKWIALEINAQTGLPPAGRGEPRVFASAKAFQKEDGSRTGNPYVHGVWVWPATSNPI